MYLNYYLQQIECAAKHLGVDVKIIAKKLNMQSSLSRWKRDITTPRQAQAERFLLAIHDEARQNSNR